jgi:Smg protein
MNANNSLEQNLSGAPDASGRERIMEIVFFLLSEIKENKPLAEIDLKPLSVRGFSEIEISTAFSWLIDKFSQGSDDPLILAVPFGKKPSLLGPAKDLASFRVYHEIESSVISKEARGFMLQMLELGILTDSDVEFMIDRIMLSGAQSASLEEVKDFVTSMLFHFDAPYSPLGRVMLSGSERVH